MSKPIFPDPEKLFLTEFMVVSVLTANGISLEIEAIHGVLKKALNQPRAARRIDKAIKNLVDRQILQVTEFGNVCLASNYKNMLRL